MQSRHHKPGIWHLLFDFNGSPHKAAQIGLELLPARARQQKNQWPRWLLGVFRWRYSAFIKKWMANKCAGHALLTEPIVLKRQC